MTDNEQTPAEVHPVPEGGSGRLGAFPIVGLGASAGGLEALQHLLGTLPMDTGMGFVIVQHLAPDHPSSLTEILARTTKMPVCEVSDEPAVEPNHVYVIPPGRDMIIADGKLKLLPQQRHPAHRSIDLFFRSLAEDAGHLAVGVVLSGGLSDGTVGLEEIKAAGGVTFAQDDSAQNASMPHSAIASGCVDFVLAPEGMAQELARIARHSYIAAWTDTEDDTGFGLGPIVDIVRGATGVDFTHYKSSTLRRRVTRRMMLHRLETSADYEEHLRQTPHEIEELYQDILISVTSFFRDPDAFDALARNLFPKLIAACPPNESVRFWVVGCSSGEEAYSLAMLFTECAEAAGSMARLQLFATDVNPRCIEKARAGFYPHSIAHEVSPERLRRFFTEDAGGYRVRKAIRERCIFSRHNLMTDPPFSRVDFISCRNLLIYLEPVLQQRAMPIFHYALKPDGWLWLGSSESVGTARTLFDASDVRHKIFSRRAGGRPPVNRVQTRLSGQFTPDPAGPRQPGHGTLHRDAERLVLAKYAPPGVVVSAGLEIVQFQGDTSPYLAPASGAASHHLLKMLREGLAGGVREALQRAETEGAPVRVEGLRVRNQEGFRVLAIEIIPIKASAGKSGGFVVLFDDEQKPSADVARGSMLGTWWKKLWRGRAPFVSGRDEELLHLKQELAATRESLQAISEQHEAVNEELRSANEEAQSANEEMQSVNEELETSKEEMEASNEELATLNDELGDRNAELNRLNEELRQARDLAEGLIRGLHVPILVLDAKLRVATASRAFYEGFRVTQETTIGRPVYELGNRQWDIPELRTLLEALLPKQSDVVDFEVRHTFETIGPRIMCLNARQLIRGGDHDPLIVMSIEDVTTRKLAEEADARLAAIVESSDDAILSKDLNGIIKTWNAGAERLFGYTAAEVIGLPVTTFIPADRLQEETTILGHIRRSERVDHFETVRVHKNGGLIDVSLTVSPILDRNGQVVGASKIARNITERRKLELALRASEERLRLSQEVARVGAFDLNLETGVNIWTPELELIHGLPQGSFARTQKAWEVLVHPDDRAIALGKVAEALLTGEPLEAEWRVLWQDGSVHWIAGRFQAFKDAAGKPVRIAGVNIDISERKMAEQALGARFEQLRLIADTAPVLIAHCDREGRYKFVNAPYAARFGLKREELIGCTIAEITGEAAYQSVRPYVERVLKGEPVEFEITIPYATIGVHHMGCAYAPERDAQGNVIGFVGVILDITERKRSEQAMRESENFNRSIVESSQDCIKVLDLEGRMLSMSLRGQRLLGIEDFQPYIGRSWIDFWEGADREAAIIAINAATAGGSGTMVGRSRTQRGETKWFDVALSPIGDSSGTPVRLLAVSRDVTDRRRAELNARFLAEVSQDLSNLSDADEIMRIVGAKLGAHLELSLCNFVNVNEAADETEVIFAWHRPDVPGSLGKYKLSEYLTPELQTKLRKGEPFAVNDTSNDPRTDALRYVSLKMGSFVCVPLIREGQWRFMLNIHHTEAHDWQESEVELTRELTTRIWTHLERVRIESALHESEARFRMLADAITQLAWIANADGNLIWYNQRWYDYTGTTPQEMEGWGWQKVHDPAVLPNVVERWKATLASGAPFDMTFPLRGADGVFRPFLTRVIPLKDEAGRVTKWFGTNTDVSELKLVEETLAARIGDLARADRSKNEFLAMLAHELRNPLAPLRNAAEIIRSAETSDEEREQAQQIINRQIENMSHMIDDLLDVSRITEGKIELRKRPVTLEAILTAAASMARSNCAAHHQELTVSMPEEPVYLNADATRLEQVFSNLLTNACKYSGDGCHISLRAERLPDADPPEVTITVADDGVGIDPELLPRIFDLFVQASRTLDRAHGGLGIGLTLVKRLVNLHGGSVEAHSQGLGHGAEFVVHLPMMLDAPPPEPAAAATSKGETPRRMLIVDDNTDSAKSMAALQRRRGHQTCTAFTGPDAIAAAANFRPQIVLLDIGLPGMDGFEVARQIRAMPALAGVYLVAMSGYGSTEDRATAKQAGFDEYLVKPLDLAVLRALMRDKL